MLDYIFSKFGKNKINKNKNFNIEDIKLPVIKNFTPKRISDDLIPMTPEDFKKEMDSLFHYFFKLDEYKKFYSPKGYENGSFI